MTVSEKVGIYVRFWGCDLGFFSGCECDAIFVGPWNRCPFAVLGSYCWVESRPAMPECYEDGWEIPPKSEVFLFSLPWNYQRVFALAKKIGHSLRENIIYHEFSGAIQAVRFREWCKTVVPLPGGMEVVSLECSVPFEPRLLQLLQQASGSPGDTWGMIPGRT